MGSDLAMPTPLRLASKLASLAAPPASGKGEVYFGATTIVSSISVVVMLVGVI